MSTLPPLIDVEALRAFLAASRPDKDALVTAERIRGGHSNETFYIRRGDQEWVLRRPPHGPLLPTAHDITREYRVLDALCHTNVPVPRPFLLRRDTSVLGAPFYLMERVHGTVIRAELPQPYDADEHSRYGLGIELVDRLADLHAVDWEAVGLADFGKPTGYLERQVRRWSGQLEASHTRPLPELDAVSQWLRAHLPASGPATIVHGDYRLDNVMYAQGAPARIVAILDWEMATLGDPLADLGYLLSFWREQSDPTPVFGDDSWRVTGLTGFASRAELVAHYAERTGRRLDNVAFYVALAIWKLAIVLEGSYARHLSGTTDDPFFAQLDEGVPALARRAWDVCRGETTFA